MIYSDFKNIKLSRLGFGCMRFAMDPASGEIDQKKVDDMFDLAIRSGVNYFDTAYPYLGGKSEIAMTKALKRYPRESYYIADKFPGHVLQDPIDNLALFQVSLQKCETDYFDFYLLHNITESTVDVYESEDYHIISDFVKMKEEGKIRYLGFSAHGGPEMLEAFLSRHEGVFDFVQIQLNYLDWTLQNAKEKYDIITRHGLGVWVMEPLRGGKLAVLPETESGKLGAFDPQASDASYAFRFLLELPNVKVILSGMNELFQVEDNLKTFAVDKPLTVEERTTLFAIAENLKKGVPCTACRYCCAGCPLGLDIPYMIECYNDYQFDVGMTPSMRMDALAEDKRPGVCIGCGQCSHVCPQGIDVPEVLAKLSDLYENGPKWAVTAKLRRESIDRDLS